ncbi:hypothetical protein Q5H93_09115 [Hymenobacter sp. ASUV-10]|uniref:Uncharacterized protein n=1 Tax=Hymenobacter aranciens TaxID=3063996 RepID=A0ABT9B9E3_9BACT|nr:hypothetical protein [Hymenobacter sp. ASUV-10]MDO7874889.1 hypothetical protein [Hymenobacter sp. ASUV-10]
MNALIKLLKFFGFALLLAGAAPAAHAQVSVNVQVGAPAWGPPVPAGVQYYYIPEIDGYYDLYTQQYLIFDNGYWVVLPTLYGYDPAYFHPQPVLGYVGPQPWLGIATYRARYPRWVTSYHPRDNYHPTYTRAPQLSPMRGGEMAPGRYQQPDRRPAMGTGNNGSGRAGAGPGRGNGGSPSGGRSRGGR